ncbi:DoxX-like family protein [Ottowia sp. VDI28]|uniref:DoxX-like family protein n=1 Tax=Ottowia sp. VDI28 TaxID=3133968 RepID=UPI003C307018
MSLDLYGSRLRVGNQLPALLLHWSVVAVWLFTAAVSVHEWHGQSSALLSAAGIPIGRWHDWLIGGGAAMDLVIGLWLCLMPSRLAYGVALAGMAVMTLAATVLLPDLWLHPLGPLSKNLPIAAALLRLMQSAKEKEDLK